MVLYTPLGVYALLGVYTPLGFCALLGIYTLLGVYTLLSFCTLLGVYTPPGFYIIFVCTLHRFARMPNIAWTLRTLILYLKPQKQKKSSQLDAISCKYSTGKTSPYKIYLYLLQL